MARIRSIHPGIWTDESFVSVSLAARLLFIGLWNEADDQGVFEWKPLTLKMRLAPADNIDAAALLADLLKTGMVMQFDAGGRRYGAVRNFRRYQRPEKPKSIHPLPDEVAAFVGLGAPGHTGSDKKPPPTGGDSPTDRRPIADASPTAPRFPGQMEEEGGKRYIPSSSFHSEEGSSGSPPGDPEAREPIQEKSKPPRTPPHPPEDVLLEMAAVWNEIAADHGLPSVRDLTDRRRQQMRARCKERWTTDPVHQFRAYVTRICKSEFLTGGGERGWKADFDWALQQRNVLSVEEGKYHDGKAFWPGQGQDDDDGPVRFAGGMPV